MSSESNQFSITIFIKNDFLNDNTLSIINHIINPFPKDKQVDIFYFNIEKKEIPRTLDNWLNNARYTVTIIDSEFTPPELNENSIIIDALFGFELTNPLDGGFAAIVNLINQANATVFSIAAPSGLLSKDNTTNNKRNIVKATNTILLQQPPLSFYFPENQVYFGDISIVDLEAYPKFDIPTFCKLEDLQIRYKPRTRFSHKGSYGHALLIAGKTGMAGAATLATKAALKSGIGLITLHCPKGNKDIHQITTPEAILDIDTNLDYFSQSVDTDLYNSIAIGPGIGTHFETEQALVTLLEFRNQLAYKFSLILDADALNLLENQTDVINNHLEGVIITPHVKEFERLVGKYNNTFLQMNRAIKLAKDSGVYIVLKGPYSMMITPWGDVKFNQTGTSGMATAGSGDVLTGILLALQSQGYDQEDAMYIGCYIHGKAGEIAAQLKGDIGMTATDIVEAIPQAWLEFTKSMEL